LFKGKRQRGVTPPPAKEFSLHIQLADILRRWIDPHWRFTHMPHGEHRSKVTAARLKRMGTTRGWPDFLLIGPGRVFFIELKRHKLGRLSDDQRDIATHLMVCGCGYLCTDNLDDVVATLTDLGALRSMRLQ
jgi:hypothetical protein